MEDIKIEIPFTITQQFVDDVMSTAFYSGISHWCSVADCEDRKGAEFLSESLSRGAVIKILVEPFEDNCVMSEEYPKLAEYILTLDKFVKGYKRYIKWSLEINKEFYTDPADIDAEIADVIVQFALFNDLMFG